MARSLPAILLDASVAPHMLLVWCPGEQVGLGGFTNGNDSTPGAYGRDVAVGSLPLDNNASYFQVGRHREKAQARRCPPEVIMALKA